MFKPAMLKHTLAAIALTAILFPSTSEARESNKIVVGVNYTQFHVEDENVGLRFSGVGLGAIGASLGYKINISDMYLLPEARVAFGVIDQTWDYANINWKLELSSYVALGLQLGKSFGHNGFAFLSTSFATVDTRLTGTAPIQTKKNDFGFGGGIGYQFNEFFSVDFSAELLNTELFYGSVNLKTYLSIY